MAQNKNKYISDSPTTPARAPPGTAPVTLKLSARPGAAPTRGPAPLGLVSAVSVSNKSTP